MRPCMLCRNIFTEASEVIDEDGDNMLAPNIYSSAAIDFATDSDVRSTTARLKIHKTEDSSATFKVRTILDSITSRMHGILMDNAFDHIIHPVRQYAHDWMHAVFVDGVFNTVMFLLMADLIAAGKKDIYTCLGQYLSLWTWPARLGTPAKYMSSIFEPRELNLRRRLNTSNALQAMACHCIL